MDAVEADLACVCLPLTSTALQDAGGAGEHVWSTRHVQVDEQGLLTAQVGDAGAASAPAYGLAPSSAQHVESQLGTLRDLVASDDALGVIPLEEGGTTVAALRELGMPTRGARICMRLANGGLFSFLVLRDEDEEPLDRIELDYLQRIVDTTEALAEGEQHHETERRIAQALQHGMRNQLQDVPGLSAQGIYTSATASSSVGGDFYDLIRLPEERACVIMGDVSGKGVEAASVSAAVRTALGAYSWEGLAPARMVELLNDFLLGFSRVETFATLFVGIIEVGAHRLTYCSAGHPPALLVRAGGVQMEWLDVQSGVVGAFHDMAYRDGVATLSPGDALLLYTDGTTEARAPDGAFFGEDGLRDAVMREWPRGFDGLLERLLGTLDAFTGRRLEDDVAMVAVRFDGLADAGAPAPAESRA
jgi:serine phosphatase RsbU (regulator of sigma subunit)